MNRMIVLHRRNYITGRIVEFRLLGNCDVLLKELRLLFQLLHQSVVLLLQLGHSQLIWVIKIVIFLNLCECDTGKRLLLNSA